MLGLSCPVWKYANEAPSASPYDILTHLRLLNCLIINHIGIKHITKVTVVVSYHHKLDSARSFHCNLTSSLAML